MALFRRLDGFNFELARKAMLAQPDAIRAVGLKRFYSKVHEHRETGRRFMLHGVRSGFSFTAASGQAGRLVGTGEAIRGSGRSGPGKAPARRSRGQGGKSMERIREKVRPIEKNKDRIVKEVLKTMRTHLC
ncbi:hypothetical protein B0G69_1848 [Paraburkholderia sp. RAU2J]|nr:hypothetical protein B0G69_1848 [Paraburkholderia sp. RAU2J]